eukprot:CAMPEP_0178750508 /NCGR_PEP_ID=MMETSP0744-20121128/10036_1 /TAXON_ID=913974 /ORGANISM="Nitzschia punctata, Strain CCMP561" /LENGTH=102 /DNA_ID=CAMNT_0020404103 /DNA_START=303 /DNA_END=607 /DNA_ORIENTATION=-
MKIALAIYAALLVTNLRFVSGKPMDEKHAELCGNQKISELVDRKARVLIWLMDDTKTQIEGQIVGCEGQDGSAYQSPLLILDYAVVTHSGEELGRIGLRSDL